MRREPSSVLGNLGVDEFLSTYWQREPLVIRGAFPGLEDPLSSDELAGLACEADVDSRLVMERGGRKPWHVTRGPQSRRGLEKLPRSHWTLLVESVDRHSAEVSALAAAFNFLPKWRMDDVMVSLAPIHGTVDAHIDSYDVFLIQGQGRRRWDVDRRAVADYRPGLDLRILKRFRPEDSWILESGDMLYVPPGIGHRGVTVRSESEVALTYSIGFRAPSSADLLSSVAARALADETPRLFSDAGRSASRDSGELSTADLEGLRRFLNAEVASQDGDEWTLCAGEAVTAGGGSSGTRRVLSGSVARMLARGSLLSPSPGARMAWARLTRGRTALFVNGESRVLSRGQAFAAAVLCARTSPSSSRRLGGSAGLTSLVEDLLRTGLVEWTE